MSTFNGTGLLSVKEYYVIFVLNIDYLLFFLSNQRSFVKKLSNPFLIIMKKNKRHWLKPEINRSIWKFKTLIFRYFAHS